ncbi:ubiquinol-cytochrome c reductase iron-sulfur subunit [Azoarcus indigens]|uniref:Ubiquinol-cytochrome c reductase iron-sulfur subunit n=1 Tax=Azoarcus indigens TaxID=29545 RepID=A0A4R6DZG7_9RHOO|nr:ubiquinol-cytochrome c reductase iron-sulfur subunit [Azoarcus indigens]NMG67451.1 ubiquinol-cytochrome c reductase iron-sulfur subunit [Azoarcus indigens]TDN50780.1 ubiquinol-cytochrome c reductase iron-sulfur subunit [Azoarcus indigens]
MPAHTLTPAPADDDRRRLLAATAGAGAVAMAATAVPFVASLTPSERARAAGAPVEVNVGRLAEGEMMTVEWRGKPVWILRRSAQMLAALEGHDERLADPASQEAQQPAYAAGPQRAIRPEFLVLVGICTHLGCSPSEKFAPGAVAGMEADWPGGFLCPCHGSRFDLAGRVFLHQPAPTNLEVPPHRWLDGNRLLVGEDAGGEGGAVV